MKGIPLQNAPKFRFRNCRKNLPSYIHTVDGRKPAPVDMVNIPLFIGFFTSQVVSRIFSINSSNSIYPPKKQWIFRLFRARTEFSVLEKKWMLRNFTTAQVRDSRKLRCQKIDGWKMHFLLKMSPFFWGHSFIFGGVM